MAEVLLQAKGLKKHFPVTKGLIVSKTVGWIKAVDGVDFSVSEGETFGLVGESGCGKTTTAELILLLEQPTGGSVQFQGHDIQTLSPEQVRNYRASVQAVFQDPFSSLSPRMRVKDIITEPIIASRDRSVKRAIDNVNDRPREVLEWVGLNPAAGDLHPHEFSGGASRSVQGR